MKGKKINYRSLSIRLLIWFFASLLSEFGIGCYYACGLGTDPVSVFVDGVHNICGLSYGNISTICNIILLILIIIFERRYLGIGTIISTFISGPLIDVFETLMREHTQYNFLAVLETNRGCPYTCAYCDWCDSQSGKKIRLFPMQRVLDDIRWIAEHKIEYCFGADANFGILERDVEIAQALIDSKKKNGLPAHVSHQLRKEQHDSCAEDLSYVYRSRNGKRCHHRATDAEPAGAGDCWP